LESQAAAIFEPLHAVPGPAAGRGIVERVTVAVKNVGISIAIEIDHRNPARTPIGICGSPQHLGKKVSLPVVDERPDLLPLLTDEADNVEMSVAVEVDGNGIDGAGQPLQDVGRELPPSQVLEPQRLSLVVAKARDHQIEIAIAVEIARSYVGN